MNIVPKKRNENGFWFDPFRELERIQNEMNSLFNVSLGDSCQREGLALRGAWTPSVEYDETENSVVIKADLPGIDKKNLDVTLQDGVLIIKGTRENERKAKESGARVTERYYGSFRRELALPTAVDESKIQAAYKDGVLTLEIPKKEEAKPKQIKVNVA